MTMSSDGYPLRRNAADNFLYSEKEKSDYDWLVTPPGSPAKSPNQLDASNTNLMLEKCLEQQSMDNNISSRNGTIAHKRPSSSNSSMSTTRRSTTPAKRSTSGHSTPATARVSSTAARASSTSSSGSTSRPSSSGNARATSTSFSTSTSKSTSRPSTPTRRPSSSGTSRANLTVQQTTSIATSVRSKTRPMTAPNTKLGSRPTTPTRRPPTPTGTSTVLKSKPTKPVCKPAPTPTMSRSRPWEPYEMPGFSTEAPPNLRTTFPDRPHTASSCRSLAFGASIERTVARRQSCSPSRNRVPVGKNANGDGSSLISPVAKGNQIVNERAMNVRKLAPRRQTESGGSNAGKSSSGSGFGRNISKSSFDMALRHMDIKGGSMKGNFRKLVTKVPAASLYSVTSSGGTRRKRPVSCSGSSESSVNILCLDGSDDNLSDISFC